MTYSGKERKHCECKQVKTEINKRISKNVTLVQPEFDAKGQLQSPHCVNNITTNPKYHDNTHFNTCHIHSKDPKCRRKTTHCVYSKNVNSHHKSPLWPTPYAVMKKEPNLSLSVQSSVFHMTCQICLIAEEHFKDTMTEDTQRSQKFICHLWMHPGNHDLADGM